MHQGQSGFQLDIFVHRAQQVAQGFSIGHFSSRRQCTGSGADYGVILVFQRGD